MTERKHRYAWAYCNTEPDMFVSESFACKQNAIDSMFQDVEETLDEDDWRDLIETTLDEDGDVWRIEGFCGGTGRMWMIVNLEHGTASE
jgi:hypothetical protein